MRRSTGAAAHMPGGSAVFGRGRHRERVVVTRAAVGGAVLAVVLVGSGGAAGPVAAWAGSQAHGGGPHVTGSSGPGAAASAKAAQTAQATKAAKAADAAKAAEAAEAARKA